MKQNDFEEKKLSEATPEHMATVVGTLATEDDPCMKARFSKKSYKDAVDYLKEWRDLVVREAIREAREELLKGVTMRKPTHGSCCTCQTCGFEYDDCSCAENFSVIKKNLNK